MPPRAATTLDTLATISFRGLPTPTPASPVAVSADLDRIAVALRHDGEVFLFDGRGQLLRQIVRFGQGPGEFLEISVLSFHPGTDSLWVLDRGNGRASVLGPEDTRPSREIPLRGQFFGAAWASDTTLVVQGRFEDGLPQDALGRAIYSADPRPTLEETDLPALASFETFVRPVTSASSGGVWVGHIRHPTLRRLDASLTTRAALEFRTDLLGGPPENAELWEGYIDTSPAVLGVTEGASGDLWVLFGTLADPLPAVENPFRALAEERIDRSDVSRTIIARYDPENLAQGPLEEFEPCPSRSAGLLPGGVVYCFDSDALGEAALTLMSLGS